jgi:serine/threonine protein phosphatase PrpC
MKIKAHTLFSSNGTRGFQEDFGIALKERGIFVVADGFGGPTYGTQASKTACESVQRFLVKEAGDLDATLPFVLRPYFSLAGNVLFNALVFANRKVKKLNVGKEVHERGGASVIAGYMDGDLLAVANVGACSATLFRKGQMVDLVIPRTYGRLRDPFMMEATTADQGIPLMAMGMVEELEPEIFEYRVCEGDAVLFYSDGLTLGHRQSLLGIHGVSNDAAETLHKMNQYLEQAGSDDNISLSLAIY